MILAQILIFKIIIAIFFGVKMECRKFCIMGMCHINPP